MMNWYISAVPLSTARQQLMPYTMRLLYNKIVTRTIFTIAAILFLHYFGFFTFTFEPSPAPLPNDDNSAQPFKRPPGSNSLKGVDPLLHDAGPPPGKLWYPGERPLANATLLALVRNSEVDGMVQSMLDLERMFNSKFNYPWTFLSEVPFDEEFKRKTRAATKAEIAYEVIPREHWDVPEHIDRKRMNESMLYLESLGIQYGSMLSYHQMCRYNSGVFPLHPALLKYRYYWRVEPYVHFYCDLPYDPFHYLADRDLIYGFVIALYDSAPTVASLWPTVLRFLASYFPSRGNTENPTSKKHHTIIHPNSSIGFLTDAYYRPLQNLGTSGYSTCHFWSNFEIGDLEFFRSETFQAYFRHLDEAGGFFYERWGDAPVHSIALSLFVDKKRIHWFRDIAYEHHPYFNCPQKDSSGAVCGGNGGAKIRNSEGMEYGEGRCIAGRFTAEESIEGEDCRANWFHYVGMS